MSALFFLVPPCSAVIAYAALDEAIPALAWPGMALAALGILLVTRARPAAAVARARPPAASRMGVFAPPRPRLPQ